MLLLGHLTVHEASAGSHPLHAAVLQQAFVAGVVAVAHAPGNHVGHGFEAPMRVIREAAQVIARVVAAEGVEHEIRIEPLLQRLMQHAGQLDAVAIAGRYTGDDVVERARLAHGGGLDDGGRS